MPEESHLRVGFGTGNSPAAIPEDVDIELSDANIRTMYEMGLMPQGLPRDCSFENYRLFVKTGTLADRHAREEKPAAAGPEPFPEKPVESTFVETTRLITDFQKSGTFKAPGFAGVSAFPSVGDEVPLGSGVTRSIIGRGGMGVVYLIYCTQLEAYRAVKLLSLESGPDRERMAARFKTEAKIAASMHHTNIVQSYLVGEWNKLPYIEMEYIPGMDIAEVVNTHGRLPGEVACAIAVNVCKGLVHAHRQPYTLNGQSFRGVVHRDLKPSNVRLSDTGDVKILDFGIARPPAVGMHTKAGQFTGSVLYAAPEQLDLSEIDFRTDIYSFGLVLYEMICGRYAFEQPSITKLLEAKLAGKYLSVDKAVYKTSPHISRIIKKCLSRDRENRYASSEILLDAVEDACARFSRERPESIVQDWVDNKKYLEHRQENMAGKLGALFRFGNRKKKVF